MAQKDKQQVIQFLNKLLEENIDLNESENEKSIYLCKLINIIRPNTISQIESNQQNYEKFFDACSSLGIEKKYLNKKSDNQSLIPIILELEKIYDKTRTTPIIYSPKERRERSPGPKSPIKETATPQEIAKVIQQRINQNKKEEIRENTNNENNQEEIIEKKKENKEKKDFKENEEFGPIAKMLLTPIDETENSGWKVSGEEEDKGFSILQQAIAVENEIENEDIGELKESKRSAMQAVRTIIQRYFARMEAVFHIVLLNENGIRTPCVMKLMSGKFSLVFYDRMAVIRDYESADQMKILLSPNDPSVFKLSLGKQRSFVFKCVNEAERLVIWKTFAMFQWYNGDFVEAFPINGSILTEQQEVDALALRCWVKNSATLSVGVMTRTSNIEPAVLVLDKDNLTITSQKNATVIFSWQFSNVVALMHPENNFIRLTITDYSDEQEQPPISILLQCDSPLHRDLVHRCIIAFNNASMWLKHVQPEDSPLVLHQPETQHQSLIDKTGAPYVIAIDYELDDDEAYSQKPSAGITRTLLHGEFEMLRKNLKRKRFQESFFADFSLYSGASPILQPRNTSFSHKILFSNLEKNEEMKETKKKLEKINKNQQAMFNIQIIGKGAKDAKMWLGKYSVNISLEDGREIVGGYSDEQAIFLHPTNPTMFTLQLDSTRSVMCAANSPQDRILMANAFIRLNRAFVLDEDPCKKMDADSLITNGNLDNKNIHQTLLKIHQKKQSAFEYDLFDNLSLRPRPTASVFGAKNASPFMEKISDTQYKFCVLNSFGEYSGIAHIALKTDHFIITTATEQISRRYSPYTGIHSDPDDLLLARFNFDEFQFLSISFPDESARQIFYNDFMFKRKANINGMISKPKLFRSTVMSSAGNFVCDISVDFDSFRLKSHTNDFVAEYSVETYAQPLGKSDTAILHLNNKYSLALHFANTETLQSFLAAFASARNEALGVSVGVSSLFFDANLFDLDQKTKIPISLVLAPYCFTIITQRARFVYNLSCNVFAHINMDSVIKIQFPTGDELMVEFQSPQKRTEFASSYKKFRDHLPQVSRKEETQKLLSSLPHNYNVDFLPFKKMPKSRGTIKFEDTSIILDSPAIRTQRMSLTDCVLLINTKSVLACRLDFPSLKQTYICSFEQRIFRDKFLSLFTIISNTMKIAQEDNERQQYYILKTKENIEQKEVEKSPSQNSNESLEKMSEIEELQKSNDQKFWNVEVFSENSTKPNSKAQLSFNNRNLHIDFRTYSEDLPIDSRDFVFQQVKTQPAFTKILNMKKDVLFIFKFPTESQNNRFLSLVQQMKTILFSQNSHPLKYKVALLNENFEIIENVTLSIANQVLQLNNSQKTLFESVLSQTKFHRNQSNQNTIKIEYQNSIAIISFQNENDSNRFSLDLRLKKGFESKNSFTDKTSFDIEVFDESLQSNLPGIVSFLGDDTLNIKTEKNEISGKFPDFQFKSLSENDLQLSVIHQSLNFPIQFSSQNELKNFLEIYSSMK
ncbi:hypothetical protein M0811_00584 [Anaeramoeba ignava]|uniref:Uncharacterized protein n=1 Tax=Anaeramoeba ignava TaxID=1746090 RepID=A0A9Q0RG13_ANAIG|nr:hypothetical protein M0811_00584 [Anaeramoeba ignava]